MVHENIETGFRGIEEMTRRIAAAANATARPEVIEHRKSWLESLNRSRDSKVLGTSRAWFEALPETAMVEMIQCNVDRYSGKVTALWESGPRPVTKLTTKRVILGESIREFDGTRVLFSTETVLGVAAVFGADCVQAIVYRVAAG